MSQDQSSKVLAVWFIAHADFAIIPRCIVRPWLCCMQMSVSQMLVGCGGVCELSWDAQLRVREVLELDKGTEAMVAVPPSHSSWCVGLC